MAKALASEKGTLVSIIIPSFGKDQGAGSAEEL